MWLLQNSTELEVHVLAYYTSQKINLLTYVRLIYEWIHSSFAVAVIQDLII